MLQLIHSVVRLPEVESNKKDDSKDDTPKAKSKDKEKDKDKEKEKDKDKDKEGAAEEYKPLDEVVLMTSYEEAIRTAVSFLSVFLKKCGVKHEDMDYR